MKKLLCILLALLFPLCALAKERPILVSVGLASNGQAAGIGKRAPWGIHEADVIYETMLYETGQTRLACLFQSQFPETVGPVRSARVSQFYLREEWDAAFVFCGDAGLQARDWMNDDLSLSSQLVLNFHHSDLLKKHATRQKGVKAPDNLSVNLHHLQADLPSSAQTAVSLPYGEVSLDGFSMEEVLLDWGNDQWLTRLQYDENLKSYQMFRRDVPFVSYPSPQEKTETAASLISFHNVIIQHVEVDWLTSVVPVCTALGSGRADYFIGGKWVEGRWERSHPTAPACWLDAQGAPITFAQGKVYIAQFPQEHIQEISSEHRSITYMLGGD